MATGAVIVNVIRLSKLCIPKVATKVYSQSAGLVRQTVSISLLSGRWPSHNYQLLHTSARCSDLNEFFDSKENWGENAVKVGRPWKMDELRLKGNTDLHKLWYVLLKERNMLMTMEAEYIRECELFPNPERLDKVEESMENLLEVVAERDRACNLLETGQTGERGERVTVNKLGIEYIRRQKEHYLPYDHEANRGLHLSERRHGWQEKFLTLLKEKQMIRNDAKSLRSERRKQKLREIFPHAEIE